MLNEQEHEITDRYTDRLYEDIHKRSAHILKGKPWVLKKDLSELKQCMQESCNMFPLPIPMYLNVWIKKGHIRFGVESQKGKKCAFSLPIPLVQTLDEVQYAQVNTQTCEEFLRLWACEGESPLHEMYKEVSNFIYNGGIDDRD